MAGAVHAAALEIRPSPISRQLLVLSGRGIHPGATGESGLLEYVRGLGVRVFLLQLGSSFEGSAGCSWVFLCW